MDERVIRNGDIWDIGQTVNGVSLFVYIDNCRYRQSVYIDNKWYYYEERTLNSEGLVVYEYLQEELTAAIIEDVSNGWNECKRIGNIFEFDEVPV